MSVHEGAVSVVAAGATVNADNPWPGLLAFREGDEGYFQGRQTETEDLLRLVLRERLVVLFGLSGLGKSSLLQAGLFPRLRKKSIFPVHIRLDFSAEWRELAPQVIGTIWREAFIHKIDAPPPRKDDETLWEYFHRDGNNFWDSRNHPVMPLLVFDQFEELFTLGHVDGERTAATQAFFRELADLAEGRPPARLKARIDQNPQEASAFDFARHYYKILLGIREDFLPDLETLRATMPTVALNRMRLQRMNGEAALLVVNQAEHLIDPEVGDQVVRFVAADKANSPLSSLEVEPALLSVVCRELNIRRRNEGKEKISADLLKGNQEQVLADFYERSTADLAPEVRSFVEDKLLTVSGYRDSVAVENALNTPGVSANDISTLVERRLVRREERGGTQRLELTHDLLAGVVRTSRDTRRQREAKEQADAALLQTQAKLRRSRLLVATFAVLALVALGTAAWGLLERARAKSAEMRAVQAQATAEMYAKQAQKAQKELYDMVEAAKGSKDASQALARIAQTASAKQIYLQYVEVEQVPVAKLVQNNLTSAGYFVPGYEKVAPNFSPAKNQVRYFHTEDQADAEKIAALLRLLITGDVGTQLTFNPKNVVPQGQFEFWLATGTRATATKPGPAGNVMPSTAAENAPALTLRGHDHVVESVAWSPDGKRLATGSEDRTVKVWDAASGKELLTLRGHTEQVTSVAWSPDGQRLSTGSWDDTAKVWDAASGRELLTLRGHNDLVSSVAWSPDGTQLATGSMEGGYPKTGVAKVWAAVSGHELLTLRGHKLPVFSVAWSPKTMRLATASGDGTAKVWDAASGQLLLTLSDNDDGVFSVAWSPDGKRLATGSWDQTAKVWDATSGKELLRLNSHSGKISVAWSPDGKRLATGSSKDETARVWDATSGKELLTMKGSGAINSVAWSPDGTRLATGNDDMTATIWAVPRKQK
jgi:WD40 repeat protein